MIRYKKCLTYLTQIITLSFFFNFRFMPDGIYINAREYGPKRLAATMNELINDPERYSQFFKWHNHYKYHRRIESLETDDYCRFCSILNEEELVKKTSIYNNFKEWWNPPGRC